ncbi:MAG: ABC transporter substrate-binding protein [Thermodesulfobacteriota bacterium]
MKNRIATLLMTCFILFTSFTLWGERVWGDTITLRADEWCPYNCTPGTQLPGYMVEVADKIFSRADHTVDYQSMPWSRAIAEARSGSINGVIGAGITDAPGFIFPTEPLGFMKNSFWARRDESWRFTDIASLQKVVLGAVQDYDYTREINEYITDKNNSDRVEVIHGRSALERNIKKLLGHRIDVIIEDENVFLTKIQALGKTQDVIKVGAIKGELKMQQLFIAFSPGHEKSAEYGRLLSDGISRLRESGELAVIMAKYGLLDWKDNGGPLH